MPDVFVSGVFDDLRSRDVRFLQEAAKLGDLTVLLWSDESMRKQNRPAPVFPQVERVYFLDALRFVRQVVLVEAPSDPDRLPAVDGLRPDMWAVCDDAPGKRSFCESRGIGCRVILDAGLEGFPRIDLPEPPSGQPKVIVTGCYDWLHSGHIRFFEEVSSLGALYVSLGSDVTIRALKGEGHPMLSQEERLYMVQAIRYVSQAFVATGSGYLDAEPEIDLLKPEIYAVNEDGDRPEKRTFCAERGIQYVVLKRLPKDGLPARQSTILRGY